MRPAPKSVVNMHGIARSCARTCVRVCATVACVALVLPHANVQRAYAATVPAEAAIIAPATAPLGQNFSFNVNFDNVGGATGYGPYVNLFMPAAGADGGTAAPNDGFDLISATFLGSPVTSFALNCPSGSSVRSPLTGLNVACPTTPVGTNKLYVLQLPFGSFTAPQAPAVLTINASMSNLADVGVPLPITAQAGFIYGDSPNNFEPSQGVITTTTVAPSLFTLTKTSDEAEGETATGRNFEHVYTITPAMPAGISANNVLITETLPPDVVLISVSGASILSGPAIPGGPYAPPNNQIIFNYGTLVGSGAPITLRYYISKTNALGLDVLPTNGGSNTRSNTVSSSGNWTPLDPRDVGSPITTTTNWVSANRTLALQKSVTDPAPPTRPNDVLTYTLSFQLSDFFSLGGIVITDTFADGQSYVPGSAALSLSERGSNVAGAFPTTALTVTNLGSAGTRMLFNISQALPALGAADGVLQGGYAITPTFGPTVGTLTYRVQVSDTYATGNALLATDRLSNTAVMAGDVLSNTNLAQVLGQVQDTTAAGFQVLGQPTFVKAFYAINGSTSLPSPLKLSPGDSVTYRLTYNLGSGDFNNLTVTDFLPLPIHDAALITSFISTTAGLPTAGAVQWGPGMTAGDLNRVPAPTLAINAASNTFALGFGTRQDATNTPTQIDLLFTSRVQAKPFVDNLYLTNQANTEQTNTAGQAITRNAIQPFLTAAPRVQVRKGVIGSSNPNSVLTSTAGPVTFAPVGIAACASRFTGTISSANQATNPIDANAQNADAGDVIRMAIVAENIGSALSGAFDVAISDTLPATMSFVPGTLCVQRGDGAILPTSSPSTSLFTTGITLSVPLSQGVDYAGVSNGTGSNLALFTFDVLIGTPISPSQTLTNSTRLLSYATQPGGPNFVPVQTPNTPITDTAQVSTAPLLFGKGLIGTELANANNTATQAVIGELITYTWVLTVPEGTTPNARITDTLPTGLAFASCTGVSASSGVTSTVALSPASVCSSDASGTTISFTLGMLTNSNTNDAVTETLTLTYTAVMLNVGANVTGTTRTNNAQFNWQGNTPLTATANAITVIEPRLLASKDSNVKFGDAFDSLTFTIIVTNPAATSTDAYETVLTDVIPVGMTYVPGSLAAVFGPTPAFQIAAPAFTATWPTLAPGQTSVLTFAVTIDSGAVPGTNLTNTARVNWTSLPGNVITRTTNLSSTERVYSVTNASAVFIVSPPTSGKSLVSTEISNTANSRTQGVIGEVLTYSVVITVPEGVTPNAVLTDALDTGLTFVSFVSITASSGLQFANPIGSYLTPTVFAFSGENGRRGLWSFGTITNTNNNNAISETLQITYTAIVLNVSNNNAGTARRNSAVFAWSNGVLAAALAQNVTIIEPRMGVTKSVMPTTGDSGDVITYTMVITGPSSTDAFEAALSDRLPFTTGSSLLLNPAIVSISANTTPTLSAANFALTGSNSVGYTLTSVGTFDLPLNAGRRITVVLAGTLPVVVVPSAFFTNTAVVTYTSLSGFAQPITRSQYNTNSTERVYTATGAAPFRILPLLATKEFITTSEPFTGNGPDGNPRVAIGEVVAYRLWIQLAESTSPNLTVDFIDNLSLNLELITGTARIALVANGGTGGITSTLVTTSTPGCGGLNVIGNSTSGVLPTQVTCPIPSSAISFDVNGRPKFAFGGVSNFDTDTDGEFVIVQFNAVVKNQASNQSGVNITNTFNVLINGALADDSPPITTTVAAPAIALSKFVNAVAPADAGDLITYTLIYTNASGPNVSAAFDLVLTDTVDANLDLLSVSLSAPNPAISYTSAGNSVITGVITTSNALTVSVAQLDPGASVTVTAVVRVRDLTANGARLPDTAFISFTSLPTTTGTISNPTSTATPGASGTITGERTGAGGVNDFFTQSNAVTTTLNTPTLVKLAPISSTYAIGELITYTLIVTMPEGVAQNVSVLDDLPSGLLPVSSQMLTNGAPLAAAYNGVVPSVVPNNANGDVLVAFGNITTTADNQSNNNAFVVQVVARVADVIGNQNGVLLTNTARLTYTNPVSGVIGLSSAQTVQVVEPSLQTSKSVIAPRTPTGAGDIVTYTLSVTNTGTATAFDLTVTDTLPSGANFVEPFTWAYSSPSTTTTLTATLTATSTITSALFTAARLDVGAAIAITFTARITDGIGSNQTVTNATATTYSSLAGAQTGERSYATMVAMAVITSAVPGLSVSKSATPTPVNAGELLTFTLRVTNTGAVQATNVVITDRVPNSTTLLSALGAVQVGNVLSWTQAILAAGASVTQTLVVLVDATLPNGANITNTVRAQSAEAVSNTTTITVPVLTQADLAVVKTATVLTPTLLDTVSFTLIVSNAGPSVAQNAIVTDALPSGLSFVTVTTSLGNYNTATGRWTIGTMTVGLTVSLQITAQVTSPSVMTNTASVGSNTTDLIGSNDTSSVVITPTARFVDLAMSKSAPPGPFYSGQLISYTLTYTNNGPDVALNSFVTDVLPSNAIVESASAGCAQTGGNITCNVGALGVNTSGLITVLIRAPAIITNPSPITNTATITAIGETTPTNNRSDVTSQIYRLTLTSVCSPQPSVYRTWRVANTGPQDVGFDWLAQATTISGTQSVTSNNQVVFDTTVGGGNVLIISIGGVTHDVLASQGGCPDLILSKGDEPDPVLAGQPLTYTLVYSSLGPNSAEGVFITDTLPAGVSFGGVVTQPSGISGPVQAGQNLTWTLGTLDANISGTIIFTVAVGTNAPERITNTASISSTTPEPNPANNTATQATNVAYADVFVIKTAQPADAVLPGGTLTWTIAFGNAGTYTATDVLISDTLPTDVSYGGIVSQSGLLIGPSMSGQRLQWTAAQLTPGANGSIVLTGTAAAQASANNVLLNQVAISSSTPQTNTANDSGNTTTLRAALLLSKQASRSPVIVGEPVSFTIRLSNTGGVTLTTIPLTDTFDAAMLQFVSASVAPSSTAAGLLSWPDVGPLSPNTEATVVVTFTALQKTNGLSTTNRVTTTASLAGTLNGTMLPLLNALAEVRITQPVLSISKSSASEDGLPVRPGERITYTVVISNAGDADATGVTVSDTLPANTSGADFAVSDITVTANSQVTFTYSITAAQPLISGTAIANRVTLSSPTAARDILTATAVVTDVIVSGHALELNKSVSPNVAAPGSLITYTLAYTASGDEPAFDVTVSDILPVGVVFVSSEPIASAQNGATLLWKLGTPITSCQAPAIPLQKCLATGAITLTAQLPQPPVASGTTFVNHAIITNSSSLSATSSATVTIASNHAFSISKTADQATVFAGTRLTYTIAYTLTGSEAAQNATIVDTLPASVTLISTVPTATTQTGQQLIWNLGTQSLITNYQLLISVLVPSNVSTGTLLSNVATITDSNGGVAGTATATTPVIALSDPFISKFAEPDRLVAGETLTFTLVFTNAGPSDAQDVVIHDPLPSSVTYGGIASALPSVPPTVNGNTLVFNIGTLASGASGEIVFTATVNLDASVVITNEATITTTTPDANSLNNTASSTTRVTYADVFVRKDVSPTAPVLAGDVLTWTITFGNAGDAIAREVNLVDVLPSGARATDPFTYSSTTTLTATATTTSTTWQLGNLPPGTSGQIVFTMTANAATGLNAILVNSVAINTTTPQTNTTNDTARTTNPKLDLAVSKVVARTPVVASESVSYTLTVYNNGSSALARVALTDTFDAAHLQFVAATLLPDVNSAGQLVWNNVGPIAIDARASVIVTFTALQPTNGLTTVNEMTATGQFAGSGVLSMRDSAALRITQPVLSVSKTSSANGVVQPNQRITYTVVISNAGDADAVSVALSDPLPANTTGADFNINGIPVATHSQISFTYSITALALLPNGTQIVNTASVTSSNSKLLTPTATVTDTVGSAHTLQVMKTAEPTFVVAGGVVTYTLAYAISGNEPAPDVTIADVLPAGVVLVSSTPPSSNLMWKIGTVNPPLSGFITVVVSVPSAIPSGTLVVNTATMTDASGLSAQSAVTTPVVFGADLNIIKSVEPKVVANGGLVTFTLVVSNPGPSDIAAPEPITIPAELQNTLGPAQPYPASIFIADDVQITDITVTLASLTHGFAADLDVLLVGPNGQRVLLMSDAGGIHPISNVSLNFHDGAPALPDIDPIPSGVYAPTDYVGNDAVDTLPAPAPARPYGELLSIFKSTRAKGEWKLFIYDDQDNDVGGALRGWTLTLATTQGNKSYSFAQGLRVLDVLPPGFTLVAASPGYAGPNPVVWVDGIRAGETQSYTIIARANRAGSDVVTNTAVVTSPLPELNLSNNTSSAAVRINSASLAVVTPTLPITPTPPGGVLTLTIPISNSGNITATGGVITITLPNGEVQVFVIGDIPPGTSVTIVLTVTVPILPPGTTVTDIVIAVGSGEVDPTPEDNTFVVAVPVDGVPRIAFAKTADPPVGTSVRVGDHITYTLVVTNVGTVPATNIILTDTVPPNTSYAVGTALPAPASSNPFVWRLPSLAVNATFSARFSVVVTSVSTGTHPITNVALLGGDFVTPTQSNPALHVYLPSAIRLLGFTAQRTAGGVQVAWVTGAEVNTFGFALYRSETGLRAEAVRATDELIAAKGTTGASYTWLDATAQPGVAYTYWLQEIETSGRINEYGPATSAQPNQPLGGPSRVFLPFVVR